MTLAAISNSTTGQTHGTVELTSEPARARLLGRAQEAGLLPVLLRAPGPALRGRLALFIEAAIEESLERRGCAPPGVGAATDLDASLSDQLYRARLIGASGLALGFESLEGIANLTGALDAEDSAVLRWWLAAAQERPVRVYLDQNDRFLGVYGSPIALDVLLRSTPAITRVPNAAPELAASVAAMNLSTPTPTLKGLGAAAASREIASAAHHSDAPEVSSSEPRSRPRREKDSPASATSRAMAALFADAEADVSSALGRVADAAETDIPRAEPAPATTPGSESSPDAAAELLAAAAPPCSVDEGDATIGGEAEEAAEPELPSIVETPTLAPALTAAEPEDAAGTQVQPEAAPVDVPRLPAGSEEAQPLEQISPAVTAAPAEPAPLHAAARDEWRKWMRELDGARGPKPLSAIERMYVSCFVPLSDACTLGIAEPAARATLDAWGESFAHSYGDAYDALRVRGKRPTMVLDVPDIAQRLARLHGARSVQLVLVDGLRFDLGLRLHEHLREHLGQRAALTERLLLWSALPTTTANQLELLARGPEGLKEVRGDSESTLPVARGRAAALLRRVRAGWRELYKLDLVEARLGEGPLTGASMEGLAREAAASIATHLERAQERTLVMVFGDHGFRLDAEGRALQGGASPEEVLVPAFAWLVGDVH